MPTIPQRRDLPTPTPSMPVQESVVLLQAVPDVAAPDPATTRRMAEDAVAQATARTGLVPERLVIMDQLHAFSVRAPRPFIDALAQQHQVARVMADAGTESALIRPVQQRPVNLPD